MADGLYGQNGQAELLAGHAEPSAAGSGGPRGREAATHRLEIARNNRTTDSGCRLVFITQRCSARTCSKCGAAYGWRVRQTLLERADLFPVPALLTLTVDRSHFGSPQEAHEFVSADGLIRRLLRRLKFSVWVWVLEFQAGTGSGWPHWHILLNLAEHADRRLDLQRAWALWRDRWGIGGLDLQVRSRFEEAAHAINYVTKYLVKQPEAGYPFWVLDSDKLIRFVQGSRSVGPLVGQSAEQRRQSPKREAGTSAPRHQRRTYLERMAGCGSDCTVLYREEREDGVSYRRIGQIPTTPSRLVLLSRRESCAPK